MEEKNINIISIIKSNFKKGLYARPIKIKGVKQTMSIFLKLAELD